MYFLFVGYYTKALYLPAAIGTICFVAEHVLEAQGLQEWSDWTVVAYCVFICLWATLFIKVLHLRDVSH